MKLLVPAVLVGGLLVAGCASTEEDQTAQPVAAAGAGPAGFDQSFGQAGRARVALSGSSGDRFLAVTAAADGATYAAGYVTEGEDQAMAVARVRRDGTLDPAFGTGGVAVVNVAEGGKAAEVARAVVVLPSGKILIGGPIETAPTATGDAAKDTDIALVRFDAGGRPDASFGTDGVARIDLGAGRATSPTAYVGDSSWGLAGLAGDKAVVFGSSLAQGADRTDADYVAVGVSAAGALDPAFGTGGSLRIDIARSGDTARTVVAQPDGKLVGTGYSRGTDNIVRPVLVRFDAAGVFDPSFGTAGVATATVLDGVAESYAVALQGDGYIVAGYGRGADDKEKVDVVVERFTAAGTWDRSFGTDGLTRIDLANEDDRARNLAVLPDGRIVLAGSGKRSATDIDSMVVLLGRDGAPVEGFGERGNLLTDLGGSADGWFGITLTADRTAVVVAGFRGHEKAETAKDDAVLARIAL